MLAGLAASAGLAFGEVDIPTPADLHRELLDRAARFEEQRRARFNAVKTGDQLRAFQDSLRETFLRLLGGLPDRDRVPRATRTGRIEADDYVVEKFAFESFPGYYVPALLYRPLAAAPGPRPAVLSPCGHSGLGKAYPEYQTLHINLAKRGYVVLTYDPVGQGERSQFWDATKRRTRYNLGCGEHAVLGNALALLGTGLARYRVWDGMRAIDYLASLPEVDAARIGCVGNSGGGTLTAYLTALDQRIAAAAVGCYLTTLPRRMVNRIQKDPSSDPEQDIFGFVSEGIDHAGLLALCAPRPVLIASATLDFFPIEGTRATFEEARRLYEVAKAGDRIAKAEAVQPHGLSPQLREAVYAWFGRWLSGAAKPDAEIAVRARSADELMVCADGQAGTTFRSRPLLSLALEEFREVRAPRRKPLNEVLRLDPARADPKLTVLDEGDRSTGTILLCVNGNEAPDWRGEAAFRTAVTKTGYALAVVDPRGVGERRVKLSVPGHSYVDPLSGVEANLAYNAFLVGTTLLSLRVADVAAAVKRLSAGPPRRRVVLCGRRDAALVACFTAAVEPLAAGVAAEELVVSLFPLFEGTSDPLNAASIVPGLLRDFGDVPNVLAEVGSLGVLCAAGVGGKGLKLPPNVRSSEKSFVVDPSVLTHWLAR